MKFRFFPLLLIIFLTGCFLETDTSTLRINLGNIPAAVYAPEKTILDRFLNLFSKSAYAQGAPVITYIHVAVYNGDIAVTAKSFDASGFGVNQTVEMIVPAGDERKVLVVAENSSGLANYYGFKTADLPAGGTVNITINLVEALWGFGGKIIQTLSYVPQHIISWEASGVKTRYYVENGSTQLLLYEGYETQAVVDSSNNFDLYVEFEVFDLKTAAFNYDDT